MKHRTRTPGDGASLPLYDPQVLEGMHLQGGPDEAQAVPMAAGSGDAFGGFDPVRVQELRDALSGYLGDPAGRRARLARRVGPGGRYLQAWQRRAATIAFFGFAVIVGMVIGLIL